MHRSFLGGLIIDCRTDSLDREAQFWSAALGYEIRPSDDPDDANYVVLDTREGEPYIELQSVEHPSRVHLDIKTDDLEPIGDNGGAKRKCRSTVLSQHSRRSPTSSSTIDCSSQEPQSS